MRRAIYSPLYCLTNPSNNSPIKLINEFGKSRVSISLFALSISHSQKPRIAIHLSICDVDLPLEYNRLSLRSPSRLVSPSATYPRRKLTSIKYVGKMEKGGTMSSTINYLFKRLSTYLTNRGYTSAYKKHTESKT